MKYFKQEAEQSLIGCMILSPSVAREISANYDPDMFFLPAHKIITETIGRMVAKAMAIDFVTLTGELGPDMLREVGGEDYLIQVAEFVPSASNWRTYLQIVHDQYQRRRLERAARDIVELARNDELEVPKILADVSAIAVEVTAANEPVETTSQALKAYIDKIDRIQLNGPDQGVSTGLADLDKILGGFESGRLYVVGARPGVGKSAIGQKFVTQCAAVSGRVLFFALEMSQAQVIARMIASRCGISVADQKKPMTDADYQRVMDAASWVQTLNMSICDRAGVSVHQIRARALAERERGSLSLIVVDYIQIMGVRPGRESRQQQIGEITRGLKNLARELNVPVVAMAQLGRESEGMRPSLNHLREAGDIENEADAVILLHRAGDRKDWGATDSTIIEAIVAKWRDGTPGLALLAFNGPRTSFGNADFDSQHTYRENLKREENTRRKVA